MFCCSLGGCWLSMLSLSVAILLSVVVVGVVSVGLVVLLGLFWLLLFFLIFCISLMMVCWLILSSCAQSLAYTSLVMGSGMRAIVCRT